MPANGTACAGSPLNRTRSTEWLLASCAIVWGVAILRPGETFDLPAYALLREIMRESAWGATAVCIGTLRILALGINGWWRRTPLLRAAGTLASAMFWLFVGVLMAAASSRVGAVLPAGVLWYGVFLAFEGWCIASAGYDMQKTGSLARGR